MYNLSEYNQHLTYLEVLESALNHSSMSLSEAMNFLSIPEDFRATIYERFEEKAAIKANGGYTG